MSCRSLTLSNYLPFFYFVDSQLFILGRGLLQWWWHFLASRVQAEIYGGRSCLLHRWTSACNLAYSREGRNLPRFETRKHLDLWRWTHKISRFRAFQRQSHWSSENKIILWHTRLSFPRDAQQQRSDKSIGFIWYWSGALWDADRGSTLLQWWHSHDVQENQRRQFIVSKLCQLESEKLH